MHTSVPPRGLEEPGTRASSGGVAFERSLVRGIAWTGGMKWLTSLLTWGVTLVVARLLTPDDYGLVAMAMVLVGVAQLAAESGLVATIIQQPDLSEPLAARIGGMAIMIAVAIAALVIGAAAPLAAFFDEPAVRWITIALAGAFLLRGVQVLRRAMLMRALRFRRIALLDAVEATVTSASTLTLAWLGMGYWALVGGVLIGLSVSTTCFVVAMPHRIEFPRRIAQLEGSLTVGAHVLGGQVAWYAYSTADMLVVGRLLGPAALGAYTFAWILAGLAVERVASLSGRVTPAVFSAVQHDRALLRRYLCTFTEGLALITMPICIGLALLADLIVPAALGDAWTAAVAPMRVLALYAAVRCIAVVLPQLLLYTGHARASLRFNLVALVVLVPLFILGASVGGTVGVAWAWVLAFPLLTAATYLRFARRALDLSLARYLESLSPAVGATMVMAIAVTVARVLLAPDLHALPLLIALVLIGAASYGLTILAFHRPRLNAVLRLVRADATALVPPTPTLSPMPIHVPSAAPLTEPAPDESSRGRLLLISFHFAPDPVIGSLRWQKFARHAAERGWGLDVIMRDDASIRAPDASRLADLPPGVRRIGVAERPFWFDVVEAWLARGLRRVVPSRPRVESLANERRGGWRDLRVISRAYFSVVHHLRQRRWARAAADAAERIVDPATHRVIIGCGPPVGAYMAARRVARRTALPLVLDLRDPWSLIQRRPESTASPVAEFLDRVEERVTVKAAALVVTNCAPVGDAMRKLHPRARIVDVPNGFDDDPMPPRAPRERFIIAYAGTVYFGRDPRTLFRALAQVVSTHALTPVDIGIEFMGAVEPVDGMPLLDLARDAGVAEFVRVHATQPRAEAMRFVSGASLLVLLPQASELAIPGKLYDYMRVDAWVLALETQGGAIGRLLRGTSASVLDPADAAAIAEIIERRFEQFRAGERGVPIASDRRFSRRARASEFFGAIDLVTGHVPPPSRERALPLRRNDGRAGGDRRRNGAHAPSMASFEVSAEVPAETIAPPAATAVRTRAVPAAGRASDRSPHDRG